MFDKKCSAKEFNNYLSCLYGNKFGKIKYNKKKEVKMIWLVTLQDSTIVEVPNSLIGLFISTNKVIKAELKK